MLFKFKIHYYNYAFKHILPHIITLLFHIYMKIYIPFPTSGCKSNVNTSYEPHMYACSLKKHRGLPEIANKCKQI